jgi:hypothetical protein
LPVFYSEPSWQHLLKHELSLPSVIAFSIAGRNARALARVVFIRPFSISEQDKFATKEVLCAVFTPRR